MTATANESAARKRLLAKVHVAKKQLGLTEEIYRAILWERFRKESAGELILPELLALVEHFRSKGWREAAPRQAGGAQSSGPRPRPHTLTNANKGPLTRKIEAYLAEAKRPKAYADGMARRMYQVEALEWCSPTQLRGIVTALEKDAQRHSRWTPDNQTGTRRGP